MLDNLKWFTAGRFRPDSLWRSNKADEAKGACQTKEEAMKRVSIASVLLSGLCVLLPVPESFAQQVAGDQIDPKAGSWKTWVISSGREFRTVPPPKDAATAADLDELKSLANKRDAAAMDIIAYWNVGPPSYRWHEIALSETMRNGLSWNFAMRHFALIHVAIYDALVAAWDSKYQYSPNPPTQHH